MDQRKLYQTAIDEAGSGDTVLATCVEGPCQGSKALFRAGTLLTALPAEAEPFWRQVRLPEDGRFCGLIAAPEESEIFCDPLLPESRLVIIGAGHVACALAAMARDCGFAVAVADDRAGLLTAERFPGCTLFDDYAAGITAYSGGNCYFAVMAADHETSEKCLAAVMKRPYAYAGMIGAARRRPAVLEKLRQAGVPEEKLAELALPIGLDIGAETPAEVAVSILAQLIARRRQLAGGAACYIPVFQELTREAEAQVLATVIRTAGSAPRNCGARLIRRPDGSILGSVGGGSVEEDVLFVAAMTMEDGVPRRVFSQSNAGGRVEVFVERI